MKRCPFCAEDIQEAAIVCKHCGRNLNAAAASGAMSAPAKQKTSLSTKAIASILLLGLIGWCTSRLSIPAPAGPTSSSSTTQVAAATRLPEPAPPIALLSTRGYQSGSGNYWYIEGQVKNISDAPLKNVEVVGSWFTRDDSFITSDTAVVEYNPILPGQTSPFKTITRGNPAMSKFTVAFKTPSGRTIDARDDREKRK